MRTVIALVLLAIPLGGCDSAAEVTDKSKQAAADAVDKTKRLADEAVATSKKTADSTKKAVDAATKTATDAVDSTKNAVDSATKTATDAVAATKAFATKTEKWWDDIPATGELSDKTTAWLKTAAAQSGESIEDVLAEGEQHAPGALQIAGALASAIDSESGFEPIYVKVGDEGQADKRIGGMDRVEVVDGLSIGLKRMDAWEGLTSKKERGYLVLWREGDHLVGFVYRSRREIDLEKVAAETPRLVALVRGATGSDDEAARGSAGDDQKAEDGAPSVP